MKSFYKQLFLGFLVLIFINFVIYYLIINPLVYKPYDSLLENVEANNLILSDSHGWRLTNENLTTQNPIIQNLLEENNIKNLSYSSDSYTDMYIKLKYLVDKGLKIDTIFLSADIHMLSKKKRINNNKNRTIRYSNYNIFRNYYSMSFPEYFIRKYIKRYMCLFDVNNSTLIQNYISTLFKTKDTKKVSWPDLADTTQVKLSNARHKSLFKKGFYQKNINVLQKIFDFCKNHNITVIGLLFPNSPTFDEIEIPNKFKLKHKIWDSLDYEVLKFKNFDHKYFSDQDHVNRQGARLIVDSIIKYKSLRQGIYPH